VGSCNLIVQNVKLGRTVAINMQVLKHYIKGGMICLLEKQIHGTTYTSSLKAFLVRNKLLVYLPSHGSFQVLTVVLLGIPFFWDITLHQLIIGPLYFQTTVSSSSRVSKS
jgi:hypothetical protein